ncbi:MAG: homoserine kinase [Anaerolineae bacterium]|nr:homoserine kinase [Anaerolineae bacterium]
MNDHGNGKDSQEVRAFAPATIANLGAGFDVLGLALEQPGDIVIAGRHSDGPPGITLEIRGDGGRLPLEPEQNTAGVAAMHLLRRFDSGASIHLKLIKGIPMAGGLGSSAGSAVAAAVAVNALFGARLRKEELVEACVAAEGVVSGFHADNVAAALLGGIIMVEEGGRQVRRLPVPGKLVCALAMPAVHLPTAVARKVLPREYPLHDVVTQTSNLAMLMSALYENDVERFAAGMVDVVAEPARSRLIPGFDAAKRAALDAGALGFIISGAGPSVCAICNRMRVARRAAEAMREAFIKAGVACSGLVARPSEQGAHVIEPGSKKSEEARWDRSPLATPPPPDHFGYSSR